ncbi:MAG: GNAT family N-acetyltransferase [Candidatus Hodarchaeota archaeon]
MKRDDKRKAQISNILDNIELFSTTSPNVADNLAKLWFLQAEQKSSIHPLYHLKPDSEQIMRTYLKKYQHDERYIVLMIKNQNNQLIGYVEIWIWPYSPISSITGLGRIQSYYFPNTAVRDQVLNYVIEMLRNRVSFIFIRLDISQISDLQVFHKKGFLCVQERWIEGERNDALLSPHPPSITIQEAATKDFPQIVPLWSEHWKLHTQLHEIHAVKEGAEQNWLKNAQENQHTPFYRCFVAKNQKKEVVAYAEASISPYPSRYIIKNYGLIETIQVHPSYRCQNIGQNLVKTIRQNYLNSNSPVLVTISNSNTLAQKFWAKVGFKRRQKHLYLRM